MTDRPQRIRALRDAMASRILVFEGAMGTMIQGKKLNEQDYRGDAFARHNHDLKGDNDLLNLTQPGVIRDIHEEFLEAGSDIIETNTFNATSIAQADYGLEGAVHDINLAGAVLARSLADEWTAKTPDKPRFVVGNMGPTNQTCSISPDVNDPGFRAVTFDTMKEAYYEQAEALAEGGVDLLMVETVFDTLNCKAALFAIDELNEKLEHPVPVIVSATITDRAGRNLSGQTVEAFWHSIRHCKPFAAGLNCGFGAADLRSYVQTFSRIADVPIAAYPNAGLPNEMGDYDETPCVTASQLEDWVDGGLVNIVGGCCGTTPDHIRAITAITEGKAPRPIPEMPVRMRLSGLEAFEAA